MRSLSVLVLGLLFCLSLVKGDQCIAFPFSLPQGASCGGAVNCASGLYCDRSSICAPRLAPGATCNNRGGSECIATASCKGPDGTLQCVANSNPGEPCSTSNFDTIPRCGNHLSCSVDGKCVGGRYGDSCSVDGDCYTNMTCVSGTCKALAPGTFCTSDLQCGPGYSCASSDGIALPVCTAKLPTGGDCKQNPSLCNIPDFCLTNPVANTSTCVGFDSVSTDGYCDTYGFVCKGSARCVKGVCSATRLDTPCRNPNHCSGDQTCACGGFSIYDGAGTCVTNTCFNTQKEYVTCAVTKCLNVYSEAFNAPNYAKACIFTNCNETYNKFVACSSASSLTLSLAFVLLISFVLTYVSF